jgi:hypothetical protein
VLELLVQRGHLTQALHLSVDAHPGEAARRQLGEQILELALAVGDQRREHQQAPALRQRTHLAHDLLGALALHGLVALVAVLHTHARVEHAQVIVDLCDRTDRRARVGGGALLLDRDRGR